MAVDDIATPRLMLRRIDPAVVDAGLAGDCVSAERLLGCRIGSALDDMTEILALNQVRLAADPAFAPWQARALVARDEGRLVGHIDFHTAPDPEHLKPFGPGLTEVGYTVFAPDRRRGYATEALRALMAWTSRRRAVRGVIAAVSPRNLPSLRLVERLGFTPLPDRTPAGEAQLFLKRFQRPRSARWAWSADTSRSASSGSSSQNR